MTSRELQKVIKEKKQLEEKANSNLPLNQYYGIILIYLHVVIENNCVINITLFQKWKKTKNLTHAQNHTYNQEK